MNSLPTVTTPIIDEQTERTALTAQIAAQLGETQDEPRYIIRLALLLLGRVRVQHLADKALSIESAGGMKTQKGQRRTVGGVFFKLLKQACTREQREQLFPPRERSERPGKKVAQ